MVRVCICNFTLRTLSSQVKFVQRAQRMEFVLPYNSMKISAKNDSLRLIKLFQYVITNIINSELLQLIEERRI